MTERKFKVGDKVRHPSFSDSVIAYVNNNDTAESFHEYLIVCDFDKSFRSAIWCTENQLALIDSAPRTYTQQEVDKIALDVMNLGMRVRQDQLNGATSGKSGAEELKEFLKGYYTHEPTPDPRYKEGDEVWHMTEKRKYLFYCYTYVSDNCKLSLGAQTYTRSVSDIEPYTGQDKPKEGTQKDRNSRLAAELVNEVTRLHPELKQLHPYTVILKSGVKVGISATIFDYITEQDSYTKSVQTVADGTIVLSEIAAIVPTENLIP